MRGFSPEELVWEEDRTQREHRLKKKLSVRGVPQPSSRGNQHFRALLERRQHSGAELLFSMPEALVTICALVHVSDPRTLVAGE